MNSFSIPLVSLTMIFGLAMPSFADTVSDSIPLWPQGAPGEKGIIPAEQDTTGADGRPVAGKRVIRLGNVSVPTITLYRPSKSKANGAAVLVCPGGGYHILAMDLEGAEVCQWFNSLGVTAALLKYRVPARPGDDKHILPLQDAQRALGLIRSRANEWKLDPKRIGILGFSAGGHLTAHVCNDFEKRAYDPVDEADQISCRPDFALMIYPAYLAQKENKNLLTPELTVTSHAPPTFIMQTEDDALGVESGIVYYLALKNARVPAEMHLYSTGGHGYGLRGPEKLFNNWPKRAEEWLRDGGWIVKKK